MLHSFYLACVPVGCLYVLGLTHAGDAEATESSPSSRLPTVIVTGIVPDDVTEAPGAANVITSDDIESLRPYTLHDALSMTAGVRTIDDDVAARRSGIGVRGAPARRSRRTLLLEDGAPINASTYLDPSAHYTPPMERLERVEILRGAGQIMNGPLNNHGMINFRDTLIYWRELLHHYASGGVRDEATDARGI